MRSVGRASVAVTLVIVSACGGSKAGTTTPEEAALRHPELSVMISKAEPPPGCQAMGTVSADGWSIEAAYEALKRKTALRLHANYVVLDGGVGGGLFGRAFQCPEAPAQTTAAPAATTACEPECSPGYACVRGTCVSACNPACDNGQRCGADRICHVVQ
jgi:hypothetical protein